LQPDFSSDGCTGFPEVWRGIDLTECCYEHDLAWYNSNGDLSVFLQSNIELVACFVDKGAWELWFPALVVVTVIGFFLFKRNPPKS
jgi:hypothetical protein